MVYCKDVDGLVKYIKEKRGIDQDDNDNLLFKIGIGKFKISQHDSNDHKLS